jgi:hypothetical protein
LYYGAASSELAGDQVLGNSIIMSTHGTSQIVQIAGLVVTNDSFEGISFHTGFGDSFVGHGIKMRRP